MTASPGTLNPGTTPLTPLDLLPWDQAVRSAPFDFHLHTNHTDGTADTQAMADSALASGIATMLFSEHVRHTSTYYPGFVSEIRQLNKDGLRAHVGVETKVLNLGGELDCSPEIASLCDAIVGSVHSPPADSGGSWSNMAPEAAEELEFELAMAIVTRSKAHILGHPMGMAVNRFGLKPLGRLAELASACRESGKAFELNTRYCSSPGEWVDIVRAAGCKVSFGSDAHRVQDVGSAWRLFRELAGK